MKNEYKIESKIYKVHDERYIKITRNQLRILDSLFIDGGKEEKYFEFRLWQICYCQKQVCIGYILVTHNLFDVNIFFIFSANLTAPTTMRHEFSR